MHIFWAVLTWLQTPPVDPAFFGAFDKLGIVAILIVVIVFGAWLFMRLLNRESLKADKLEAENINLTRQHEHMSLEAIGAVRELSGELKALQEKCVAMEHQLALLLQRLDR